MNIIDPFKLPSLPLAYKDNLPKCPAIYFVICNRKFLYIGSTINLKARWQSHEKYKCLLILKDVHINWFQSDDISFLNSLESQVIKIYKPFLNKKGRVSGDGSGCIYSTVTKKGKEYCEAYYQYELWSKGDRLVKSTKYIPKRLVLQVQRLEKEKAPVREILQVLGVNI